MQDVTHPICLGLRVTGTHKTVHNDKVEKPLEGFFYIYIYIHIQTHTHKVQFTHNESKMMFLSYKTTQKEFLKYLVVVKR